MDEPGDPAEAHAKLASFNTKIGYPDEWASEYRNNGVLRNMDAFIGAFDVQSGDGMWLPPEERVEIW